MRFPLINAFGSENPDRRTGVGNVFFPGLQDHESSRFSLAPKENLVTEIVLDVEKLADSEVIDRETPKIEWSLELLCSARFLLNAFGVGLLTKGAFVARKLTD